MAVGIIEKIKDIASDLAYAKRKNRFIKLEMTFSLLTALAFIFNLLLVVGVIDLSSVMSGSAGIAVVFMGIACFFNLNGYYAPHVISGISFVLAGVLLALSEFYVRSGSWLVMVYISIIILGVIASAITTLVLSRRGI